MNSERHTWQVALLVVGVVAVAAVWGVVFATSAEPVADVQEQPASLVTGDDAETVVVALGDSFTGGSDMNRGPVWFDQVAAQEDWVAFNEAVGGSGYTVAGSGEPIPAHAGVVSTYTADLVIVAGGRNDTEATPEQVATGASRTIARIRQASPSSDVVLFSPFVSGAPTADSTAMADALQQVAGAKHVAYLNVTGLFADHPDLIGADGIHPTDAGHQLMAARIGRALDQMGLPDPRAY